MVLCFEHFIQRSSDHRWTELGSAASERALATGYERMEWTSSSMEIKEFTGYKLTFRRGFVTVTANHFAVVDLPFGEPFLAVVLMISQQMRCNKVK